MKSRKADQLWAVIICLVIYKKNRGDTFIHPFNQNSVWCRDESQKLQSPVYICFPSIQTKIGTTDNVQVPLRKTDDVWRSLFMWQYFPVYRHLPQALMCLLKWFTNHTLVMNGRINVPWGRCVVECLIAAAFLKARLGLVNTRVADKRPTDSLSVEETCFSTGTETQTQTGALTHRHLFPLGVSEAQYRLNKHLFQVETLVSFVTLNALFFNFQRKLCPISICGLWKWSRCCAQGLI